MTIRIFRGKASIKHDVDRTHPESPDRLFAIDDQLLASGLEMVCEHADATPIAKAYLTLAHSPTYIDEVFAQAAKIDEAAPSNEQDVVWLAEDTGLVKGSLTAALESAGAACLAVDWVMQGHDRQGFCATRPPGHHATYDSAMGFCIFNNIFKYLHFLII